MAAWAIGWSTIGLVLLPAAVAQDHPPVSGEQRPGQGAATDALPDDGDADADPAAPQDGGPANEAPDAAVLPSDPGYQRTIGISNRNQAISACLAAVHARFDGEPKPFRADGNRGEWTISGALADGRSFSCAVRRGAIVDVERGG
jgi:hypothetical protein